MIFDLKLVSNSKKEDGLMDRLNWIVRKIKLNPINRPRASSAYLNSGNILKRIPEITYPITVKTETLTKAFFNLFTSMFPNLNNHKSPKPSNLKPPIPMSAYQLKPIFLPLPQQRLKQPYF